MVGASFFYMNKQKSNYVRTKGECEMVKVILSAGHGAKVSGANGFIKEHDEAVRLGKRVVEILGKEAIFYRETTATSQRQNLSNIVAYHNSKSRVLDVSLHFNSASFTATGSECLYLNPKLKTLSTKMSKAMSGAMGISDRGPKYRSELYFLRNTNKPAILLEVCFVSSKKDSDSYKKNFEKLAQAIAKELADYAGIDQERKNDGNKPGSESAHVDEVYHKVQKGETLYAIATKHGLSVDKLKSMNKLNSNVIQPGDKLQVK